MKVDKLLKKYLGLVDVEFYKNKHLIEHTTTRDVYKDYPLDYANYTLLNSKIKSYRVVVIVGVVVIQINIKS